MKETISVINKFKIFLIVFCTLNIVFLFYQTSFFIGNHDWDWIKGTTQVLSLDTGLFEGRYAKFILNSFLFGGQILPILNTVTAFILLALGLMLLVDYWNIKGFPDRIIVALVPALAPFILGWLYFPINILGNFMIIPLVVYGLKNLDYFHIKSKIIAVICFLLALGVYPSAMETIIICWCFKYLLSEIKNFRNIVSSLVIIVGSFLIFKLLLTLLASLGVIYTEHYNLKTVKFLSLFSRIPSTISIIFHQLVDTLPFFPNSFKIVGGVLIITAVTQTRKDYTSIILWLVAMFSTALSAHLTAFPEDVAYMPRVNFYGLNFLYAGAIAMSLNSKKQIIRNMSLLLSVIYLFISINADIYAAKVWQMGKTAEENLVKRIINRIEEQTPYLPITGVIAGELPLRPKYYMETYQHHSPYLLNAPFIVRHIPSGMFNFYQPFPIFTLNSQISGISNELYMFLKKADDAYPSSNGLFVDDKYAIILLTKEGIRAIKAQLP